MHALVRSIGRSIARAACLFQALQFSLARLRVVIILRACLLGCLGMLSLSSLAHQTSGKNGHIVPVVADPYSSTQPKSEQNEWFRTLAQLSTILEWLRRLSRLKRNFNNVDSVESSDEVAVFHEKRTCLPRNKNHAVSSIDPLE